MIYDHAIFPLILDGAVTPAEDTTGSETGSEEDDDDEDGEVTFEFRGNVAWPAFSDSDSF